MKRLFILFLLSQSLFAQDDNIRLPDVVVTARKKTENLQKVPISTTSFNEEQIQESGATSVRDLIEYTPNVSVVGSSSGRYITPYIRGQGNQDVQLPDEVSVAFYLDEVPLPRYAFDNELLDIERVDVMRGPQGTLFGKNTQAGAINILTKDPSDKHESQISLMAGNQDQRSVTTMNNQSYLDGKLRNRFAFKYAERGGWINDTLQKKELGDMDVFAFNNTLSYASSDTLKYVFKLTTQDENGTDPMFVKKDIAGYPKSGQDIVPAYQDDFYGTSLKITKDFESTRLTTIAAANYHDFHVRYDEADEYISAAYLAANGASVYLNDADVLWRDMHEYERLYYGEVRLENTGSGPAWTVGANLNHQNYRLISHVNTFRPGPVEIDQNVRLRGTNLSLFGEVSSEVASKLTLTGGARLIYDDKKYDVTHTSTSTLTSYKQESSKDYTNGTGRLALEYQVSETIMPYISIARGYQSGGYPSFQFNAYNNISEDQLPYKESSSLVYEIGAKTETANKRLRTNFSLYFNDIKDKQIRVKDPDTNLSGYKNVDSDIFGGEVEQVVKLTHDLTFSMGIGYTNAKFAEAVTSDGKTINHKGGRIANIPYWSGSALLRYARYFSSLGGMISTRLAYKYTGTRYGDNNNLTTLGSYGLWDFSLGYEHERFGASFFMNNIFDKSYESQGYYYTSLSTGVSSPGMPRLFGIRGSFYF